MKKLLLVWYIDIFFWPITILKEWIILCLKKPNKNKWRVYLKNHFLEQKIWISCFLFRLGDSNFLHRRVIWHFFWQWTLLDPIWPFSKIFGNFLAIVSKNCSIFFPILAVQRVQTVMVAPWAFKSKLVGMSDLLRYEPALGAPVLVALVTVLSVISTACHLKTTWQILCSTVWMKTGKISWLA